MPLNNYIVKYSFLFPLLKSVKIHQEMWEFSQK